MSAVFKRDSRDVASLVHDLPILIDVALRNVDGLVAYPAEMDGNWRSHFLVSCIAPFVRLHKRPTPIRGTAEGCVLDLMILAARSGIWLTQGANNMKS